MMGSGRLVRFTATGNVEASGNDVVVQGFTLSPGSAISTFTLREGGAGGTIVGNWTYPANGAAVPFPTWFRIKSPHLTISGAAAEASFVL